MSVDVSKRLTSPDNNATAFLHVSNSGSERIIGIEILTDPSVRPTSKYSYYKEKTKRIFSKHVDPDLRVNLHENIEWSADSSLLLLSVDKPAPFKWAYDFLKSREVTEELEIRAMWLERNQTDTSDERP